MLSLPARVLIILAVLAAVGGLGFMKGWQMQGDRFEAYRAQQALNEKVQIIERQKIVNQVVTKVVTVKEIIERQADEIDAGITEAARHGELDGELSSAFRRLYDTAATGLGPRTTPSAPPTPVAVEAVARSLADNFAICRKNAADHNGLIDAIEQMMSKGK